jgi:hypothetical protein
MTSLRRHYPDQVQGSRQSASSQPILCGSPSDFKLLLTPYDYIVNYDEFEKAEFILKLLRTADIFFYSAQSGIKIRT